METDNVVVLRDLANLQNHVRLSDCRVPLTVVFAFAPKARFSDDRVRGASASASAPVWR